MTFGAFLEYVLSNGCHIYQETQYYYKLRKDGTKGTGNMSGLPFKDPDKDIKPVTACQICHNLGISIPDEVSHAEDVVNYIRNQHNID